MGFLFMMSYLYMSEYPVSLLTFTSTTVFLYLRLIFIKRSLSTGICLLSSFWTNPLLLVMGSNACVSPAAGLPTQCVVTHAPPHGLTV